MVSLYPGLSADGVHRGGVCLDSSERDQCLVEGRSFDKWVEAAETVSGVVCQ